MGPRAAGEAVPPGSGGTMQTGKGATEAAAETASRTVAETTGALQSLADKVMGWGDAAIVMLPNLVSALVTLLIFWIAAKLTSRAIKHPVRRATQNEALVNLVGIIAKVGLVLLGFVVGLSILKLDGAVASLLAGVGVIGLALGFAFQDIISNFVAGVFLAVRKPFTVGDMVETSGYMASVEEINLRSTVLRTFQGQIVTLPNKDVFGSAIVNYSVTGGWRIEIPIGVSYGDDLDEVERVATEAIEQLDERDPQQPIQLWYTGFGTSSIDFSLRFWIKLPSQDFLTARHKAIKAVKKAFDQNGITIPFPIRTLDFGSVGGRTLDQAWSGPDSANRSDGQRTARAG
jgi:small conductance mechanosensitive channel